MLNRSSNQWYVTEFIVKKVLSLNHKLGTTNDTSKTANIQILYAYRFIEMLETLGLIAFCASLNIYLFKISYSSQPYTRLMLLYEFHAIIKCNKWSTEVTQLLSIASLQH
jgi:hypothetical protein